MIWVGSLGVPRTAGALLLGLISLLQPLPLEGQQSLGRVQFAPTIRLEGGLVGGTDPIRASLESALARSGIGRSVDVVEPRFVARVSLTPISEEMVPGTPPMFALRTAVNVVFLDEVSGVLFSEYSAEHVATGRTREQALLATQRQVRFDGAPWRAAAEGAQGNAILYFESRCDAVMASAQALMQRGLYQEAIAELASVPTEAMECRYRAEAGMIEAHFALQRRQCEMDIARGRALWASSRSRQNALATADAVVGIPPSSPCFAEADALLSSVSSFIAQSDREAAQAVREAQAQQRQIYRDQLDRAQREFSLDSLSVEKQFQQSELELRLRLEAEPRREGRVDPSTPSVLESGFRNLLLESAEKSSIIWLQLRRRLGG